MKPLAHEAIAERIEALDILDGVSEPVQKAMVSRMDLRGRLGAVDDEEERNGPKRP